MKKFRSAGGKLWSVGIANDKKANVNLNAVKNLTYQQEHNWD